MPTRDTYFLLSRKHFLKHTSAIFLFCFLLLGCQETQPLLLETPKAELIESLQTTLPVLMDKEGIAGTTVAVIRDGKIEFIQNFGFADKIKKIPIDNNTVFELASLGKPIFAFLVIKLSQKGIINLDTPLVKYVPELFSAKDPNLNKITARMILSHTSGLSNYGTKTPESLKFTPGSNFRYSGIGFSFLQKVIEKQTGQSLEQLAKIHIFQPLDMQSTSFIWRSEFSKHIAIGYDGKGNPITKVRKPTKAEAAWSLYSTVNDYAKFVTFCIKVTAKKEGTLSQMSEPQIKITKDIAWGIGWGIQLTEPNSSFWHWGSNPGYRSYVVGYPKEKVAVVAISNSSRFFRNIDEIVALTIGGELSSYHWF